MRTIDAIFQTLDNLATSPIGLFVYVAAHFYITAILMVS